jgi:hypothetical protein
MKLTPPLAFHAFADWSETKFAELCEQRAVQATKPARDRNGWDFFVEWDQPRRQGFAHDTQSLARAARIQVKSGRGSKPVARLKLTNALRFAKAIEPCFLVYFWFNSRARQVEVFCREFGEDEIRATLLRAREADRAGVASLNRIEMTFPFNADIDAADPVAHIQARCDIDPAEYAGWKTP